MDYLAENISEEALAGLPSLVCDEEERDDAQILSELRPTDVALEIIPQNRVHLGWGEPHEVIRTYDAEILVDAYGHTLADADGFVKAGMLRFHIINMEFPRAREGFRRHPHDICDSHSQTLYDVYAALFQRDKSVLKRAVANRLDPDGGGWFPAHAIMYIEMLSVDKAFRGHKFGQAALEIAIRHYGLGCELAALNVRAFETERHTPEGAALDKRLTRMYKKYGFVTLPNSRFMVRNLEVWAPRLDWLDK